MFVLACVVAASVAVSVAIRTAVSRAGPPPPPPPFGFDRSRTLPVAGRAFTAVVVAHSLGPWRLACSAHVMGHSIRAHTQEFPNAWSKVDVRSCSFSVPRRTAGKAVGVTVNATDSSGHSSQVAYGWRIGGPASRAAAAVSRTPASPALRPPGWFHFRIVGSRTPPVAGHAFTAVLVTHSLLTGGPWTLTCSVSLRRHSIVPHVQEFGDTVSTRDTRSCTFDVPRGTAGKLLAFTVNATDPSGNSRHTTGGWRIVSRG